MGKIPEFNRTVLPDNSLGMASSDAVRAQYDVNADNIQQSRHLAVRIEDTEANYQIQEAQAKNATFVNEAAVQAQMAGADMTEKMRMARQGNPANFAKDFDKELGKSHADILKTAPSEAARSALKTTLDRIRGQNYEENVSWGHQRQVSLFAASSEKAADLNDMGAYNAGMNGKDFSTFANNAHANAVSASTYATPEAAANFGVKRLETAASNYLDGVSESDPVAAMKLVDDPEFKKNFSSAESYSKTRDAVRTRALKLQEINADKQVLNTLKDENSLLSKSLTSPLPFADLQKELTRTNMSLPAQRYFMKANGYTNADGVEKLDHGEQIEYKSQLYDDIINTTSKEDLTTGDIKALQERIYTGMANSSLTEKEGVDYLNQVLTPMVEKKEEALGKFQSGVYNPFMDNLGFDAVKQTFEDEFSTPVPDGKDAGPLTIKRDNENKVKLYDYYKGSLETQAAELDIPYGNIPDLPMAQRREIYLKAQNEAKTLYLKEKFPELANAETMPDSIITGDGRKINTGLGKGKPTAAISLPEPEHSFKTEAEMDAANLPDGTMVFVNGVKGIVRK